MPETPPDWIRFAEAENLVDMLTMETSGRSAGMSALFEFAREGLIRTTATRINVWLQGEPADGDVLAAQKLPATIGNVLFRSLQAAHQSGDNDFELYESHTGSFHFTHWITWKVGFNTSFQHVRIHVLGLRFSAADIRLHKTSHCLIWDARHRLRSLAVRRAADPLNGSTVPSSIECTR